MYSRVARSADLESENENVYDLTLTFDDGTVRTVVFHTASEEKLYIDTSGDLPVFPRSETI